MPLEMPRQEVLDRKSSSPPTRSLGIETAMELGSHCTGTAHKTNVEVKSSNTDRKRNKVVEIGSAHLDRSVCHLPRSDPGDNDSNMIRPLRKHPWLQPPFTLSQPAVSTQPQKPQCMS